MKPELLEMRRLRQAWPEDRAMRLFDFADCR